jgi:hypothetical protein
MKNSGIYTFADGYEIYTNGMSATERRNYEREHGRIVRYIPC